MCSCSANTFFIVCILSDFAMSQHLSLKQCLIALALGSGELSGELRTPWCLRVGQDLRDSYTVLEGINPCSQGSSGLFLILEVHGRCKRTYSLALHTHIRQIKSPPLLLFSLHFITRTIAELIFLNHQFHQTLPFPQTPSALLTLLGLNAPILSSQALPFAHSFQATNRLLKQVFLITVQNGLPLMVTPGPLLMVLLLRAPSPVLGFSYYKANLYSINLQSPFVFQNPSRMYSLVIYLDTKLLIYLFSQCLLSTYFMKNIILLFLSFKCISFLQECQFFIVFQQDLEKVICPVVLFCDLRCQDRLGHKEICSKCLLTN